jgi:hypothetical protein
MAHADPFPEEVLNSIAAQIGLRLILPSGAERAELRETFSVWLLGLESTANWNQPIARLAVHTGQWHHQISTDGRANAFARSAPFGPTAADWSISQVATDSAIAAKIDRAIEWVDKKVSEDALVRLLIVPSYYLHAFWLQTPEHGQIVVIDRPDSYTRLNLETLYIESEFLELLAKERHAEGIPVAFL